MSAADQETIHQVPLPTDFFKYLVAEDGAFLSFSSSDGLTTTTQTDDSVLWELLDDNTFRHVATDQVSTAKKHRLEQTIVLEDDASERALKIAHGPAMRPSDYLDTFRRQGWVCLTQILDDATLFELERTACTDRFAELKPDTSVAQICQNPAVARTVAEPLSLWLIRQYMKTEDIRLSHVPGFAVLSQDDGKRNVQGWHSDFPYHWGVPAKGTVPTPSGETVLGVQRNVCISPFTRNGGATIFKLGSHAKDCPPPSEWGLASAYAKPGYRQAHGLPYGGSNADVIEAPGGSIILYDSRTWHRAGINRTTKKRAALLQAMTPMYVFPKNDTSQVFKRLMESEVYGELNSRERQEIQNLMVHQYIGPFGEYAITVDRELTEKVQQTESGGY